MFHIVPTKYHEMTDLDLARALRDSAARIQESRSQLIRNTVSAQALENQAAERLEMAYIGGLAESAQPNGRAKPTKIPIMGEIKHKTRPAERPRPCEIKKKSPIPVTEPQLCAS